MFSEVPEDADAAIAEACTPQLVPVSSCCSTSLATYVDANPVLYPAGLVPPAGEPRSASLSRELHIAEGVSAGDGVPVHCCPADLAAHSSRFRQLFLSSKAAALDLRALQVASHVSRQELSNVVASLYSRQLALSVHSVEPILRLAVLLGMDCVKQACVGFIIASVVPISPVEVCCTSYSSNRCQVSALTHRTTLAKSLCHLCCACTHMLQAQLSKSAVQVRQLGLQLSLAPLVEAAELACVSSDWGKARGQDLREMLHQQPLAAVKALLHHARRAAVSELEVRLASQGLGLSGAQHRV